jgi:DNA uptake protein ComE-like DNA-binding protein
MRRVLAVGVLVLAAAMASPGCRFFRRNPDAPAPAPAPIDLNRASRRKVERLPGITPSMAKRIVEGRPYAEARELVTRGILTPREFERIAERVQVDEGRP